MAMMTCTVVIGTYNGEKYIQEQLSSLISQTRKPNFILISDDSSKDKTIEICKSILSDSGIEHKIVINDNPLGVSLNFIKAAVQTFTDVVFFCDQDDIWTDDKIEIMMDVFENHPDCSEVLSNSYIWNYVDSQVKAQSDLEPDTMKERLPGLSKILPYCEKNGKVNSDDFWRIVLTDNIATGMSMAVTHAVIESLTDYVKSAIDEHNLLMFHDSYYNLIAGAIGNVYVVNTPTAYYRQHGANVQGVNHRLSLAVIKRSRKRIQKSFLKIQERINIIEEINDKNKCLNMENEESFRRMIGFYEKREEYIKNHKVGKMIRLVRNNARYYKSKNLMLRDIFVTAIY